jgi:hypothetical protein
LTYVSKPADFCLAKSKKAMQKHIRKSSVAGSYKQKILMSGGD